MSRAIRIISLSLFSAGLFSQQEDSLNLVKEIPEKIKMAQDFFSGNKKEEADRILMQLEHISDNMLNVDTMQYANSLNLVAKAYTSLGEFSKAQQSFLKSNKFIIKGRYKNDSLFSVNLGELARLFYYQRNYDSASLYIKKAIGIQEKAIGKTAIAYALSLCIRANVEVDLGDYEKARDLAEESKKILENKTEKNTMYYANNLTILAKAYSYLSDFTIAEPMLLEAIEMQSKLDQLNSLDHARTLVTLANLYVDNGNYERAEPLFSNALSIVEKIMGKQNLLYSAVLSDYALLLRLTGQLEKAEPALLHDKLICESNLGRNHLDYSTACNNLALFYEDVGNYEKAEPLFLEAKEITEKTIGKDKPDYSAMLNNLGHLYEKMGLFHKSELLHQEDRSLCAKILGKYHPDYIASVHHLANVYYEQGKFRNADSLYVEAISKWRKLLGKWNPDYAMGLYSYGKLQLATGNYIMADSLLKEAKMIQEKVLGRDHADYLNTCIELSELYERQLKWDEAEFMQEEVERIQFSHLSKAVSYLSVLELTKYIRTFEQINDQLFSVLIHRMFNHFPTGKLSELCFDNLLFYKGFLLSSASKLNVLANASKETSELNQKRKMYFRSLAKEFSKPMKDRDTVAINDLQEKANSIEKELAKKISGYSAANSQVRWKQIRSMLKPDEAVIEFVSFQKTFPLVSDSIMYAAIMLRPGTDSPEYIFLCEHNSLDSLLHSNGGRKSDYVNELYTLSNRGAVSMESPRRSLYELFWKPLDSHLLGVKTIYFSTSGLLHRINPDAIPVSETETLADRYQLIQLNSTRQLINSDKVDTSNFDASLYGGIQFETDTTLKDEKTLLAFEPMSNDVNSPLELKNRGGTWNYLPGTDREVNAIGMIMKASGLRVIIYKGNEASEESFKNLGNNNHASPGIIHLATHGYFFADPKDKVGSSQLAVPSQEPVFKLSDHPMLRSGLIMAGGNAAWQGKPLPEGKEDGILTAYEISQLNLSNTELVVLSACETGLGDIQGNEGVYGLQRAFKIAGAKYLIMSLWQVPDKQTSLLMTTFYRKWLGAEGPAKGGKKMSIPDAFHAAQKELRDLGLDPYQWAGFVLVE